MSRFRHKQNREVPGLNLAALPDLIFTVLFFFMIVTHMRSDEVKVRLQVPQGSEVQKLANKSAVANLYIGQRDGQWCVQLNGDLIRPEEIPARIEKLRAGMSPENAEHLTISFRADRKAPMGLVSDVKRALQRAYALRINYSATDINNSK